MPVSINNTTLTFNDATTQTTSGVTSIGTGTGISSTGGKTPTLTNTGVTSVTGAGTVSVSASTGGVTITGTGGSGTVTSVATGNGLQGGTITSTGTLSLAAPGANTVGSYIDGYMSSQNPPTTFSVSFGSNYAIGTGPTNIRWTNNTTSGLSGTWKWMGYSYSNPGDVDQSYAVCVKVS
jgi:hypothetical protein